jgi:hypothetical protein
VGIVLNYFLTLKKMRVAEKGILFNNQMAGSDSTFKLFTVSFLRLLATFESIINKYGYGLSLHISLIV